MSTRPSRSPSPLPVAFSPCPNDTYLFHAWQARLVGQGVPMSPVLADIQQLNAWALEGRYPVSKVSIHCLGKLLDDYLLLPSGCALGRGCGPKIVAKKRFSLAELGGMRVAIPGQDTTAHLLFTLLSEKPTSHLFLPYDQITTAIKTGVVDCGIIVHETRFTYQQEGLVEVADLGSLWEERFGLPIPLGGVVAKRQLGQQLLEQISNTIAASLAYARKHPKASQEYILAHSQEKDPTVVRRHIDLYVTDETAQLSEQGGAAIDRLLTLAHQRQLVPCFNQSWRLR